MRDITFYDLNFSRLGEFSRAISVNFEKKFCGYGSAEVHFSLKNSDVIKILDENPRLIFVADGHSAVVTGWRIAEDIAIFGRTPEWLFTKRGLAPFSRENISVKDLIYELVESCAKDFITIEPVEEETSVVTYSEDEAKPLYETVRKILEENGLGFDVEADVKGKRFLFRLARGKVRPCLLSQPNKTAYDMKYTVDLQNANNGCGWHKREVVFMGGWDAYSNSPKLEDNLPENAFTYYQITSESYDYNDNPVYRFGLFCKKDWYLYSDDDSGKWKISETKPETAVWVHIENESVTGAAKWETVLSGTKTHDDAIKELQRNNACHETEAEVKDVIYGEDYSLGDIVRVQFEVGTFRKTEKKRVAAVNIYEDVDKAGVIPILSEWEELDSGN